MAKHGDNSVYFLLVYSFDDARLVEQNEFTAREIAIDRYDAAERFYRGQLNRYEVVLIAADSIETVMTTHGHYFATSSDSMFSEFLADV